MWEPVRDDKGNLWRVLLARYVTANESRQVLVGYEPSAARMFSLTYFSLLCPNKPLLEECLIDVINNVVQKRFPERFGIAVDSKYMIVVDTSPAQVERMVEALHSDINSMLTAVYAEFQDLLQTMLTFERLARALSKKNMNWLAFIIKFIKLFPLLMNSQHTGEEG